MDLSIKTIIVLRLSRGFMAECEHVHGLNELLSDIRMWMYLKEEATKLSRSMQFRILFTQVN
jgi:hypothetical protein